MTAVGGAKNGGEKSRKLVQLTEDARSVSDILKGNLGDDVPHRTRRLLLILPGVLMGFVALCLLTAYFCVTQSASEEEPYDRSKIHEEKFLLVASHDGHRTWNHVTLDGTENIAQVEIPTFGQFRQSIIIYDFGQGFMADKDIDGKRCFVKRIHEYLEGSLQNLDRFKGANMTLQLKDVAMAALPGEIPMTLLRDTAGQRLANMCAGMKSYWIVHPTVKGSGTNQTLISYHVGDTSIVPVDTCDVRVADILSSSLLCVRFPQKKTDPDQM